MCNALARNSYTYGTPSQVYDGPLHVRSGSVSRQRHYASGYPAPKTRVCEDGVGEQSMIMMSFEQSLIRLQKPTLYHSLTNQVAK